MDGNASWNIREHDLKKNDCINANHSITQNHMSISQKTCQSYMPYVLWYHVIPKILTYTLLSCWHFFCTFQGHLYGLCGILLEAPHGNEAGIATQVVPRMGTPNDCLQLGCRGINFTARIVSLMKDCYIYIYINNWYELSAWNWDAISWNLHITSKEHI